MTVKTCKECGATFLAVCQTCAVGLVVVSLARPKGARS